MVQEIGGIKVIENPQAGEVFADDAASFSLVNGVLRITFTAFRPLEIGGESGHVVIGRLAMPLVGAQSLSLALYNFLKERGCDPSALISEGKAAN